MQKRLCHDTVASIATDTRELAKAVAEFRWRPIDPTRAASMEEMVPPARQDAHGFLAGEPLAFRECAVNGVERNVYTPFLTTASGWLEGSAGLSGAEWDQLDIDRNSAGGGVVLRPGVCR